MKTFFFWSWLSGKEYHPSLWHDLSYINLVSLTLFKVGKKFKFQGEVLGRTSSFSALIPQQKACLGGSRCIIIGCSKNTWLQQKHLAASQDFNLGFWFSEAPDLTLAW